MNYPTLVLMASDAPRYVSGSEKKTVKINSREGLENLFGKATQ